MINLKPITVEGVDCRVNSYLSLLQYYFGEYQYAFLDTWFFSYDPSEQFSFGEAINIPMRIYRENIQHYYSAETEKIFIKPWRNFKTTALRSLEKDIPIIVCGDTYYCNWYENFKKSHSEHTFMITGFDDGVWNVVDTVPPRTDLQVLDIDLQQGILDAETMKFSKRNESITLKQFLKHTLERKKNQYEQEKLEQFVKDFDEINLEDEIICDKYVWSVPILKNVRRIYYSRKQFLDYVDYIKEEKNNSLVSFLNKEFTPIVIEWAVVMNVLYKMHISRKFDQKDKIRKNLHDIAQKEKKFINKIEQVISCPEVLMDYNEERNNTKVIQLFLEYNDYSHFFETKDFIRKTDLFEGQIIINGKKIKFSETKNGKCNCMCCKGQKIELPKNTEKFHLIGYGIWGNQMANYQIITGEEKIEGELRISDWSVKPQFGESILWQGEFVQNATKLSYSGRIFDIVVSLPKREIKSQLKLPDCKEIVLFAIAIEVPN